MDRPRLVDVMPRPAPGPEPGRKKWRMRCKPGVIRLCKNTRYCPHAPSIPDGHRGPGRPTTPAPPFGHHAGRSSTTFSVSVLLPFEVFFWVGAVTREASDLIEGDCKASRATRTS